MLINIDKNTELIVSMASVRGSTGVKVQNFLYRKYNINFIYKPLEINEKHKIADILKTIKILKIKGAAVSMPFKSKVLDSLDMLDDISKKTGSVNTIINNADILIGYNTDYYGIIKVLSTQEKINRAIIYGSGSVARTIIVALKDIGCDSIRVISRSKNKYFNDWLKSTRINLHKEDCCDIIINCTPVGMNNEKTIVPIQQIKNSRIVFDLVTKNTNLMKIAKKEGKICVYGKDMALWQSLKQFYLYTGKVINNESEFKELKSII